ncbi:MAG: efflux RND transporter periplasmic adaptor subunit [Acidobacteriota bacterium]|nr:efflux RND transporter periplasmic adaptor subunit [Acidobacteriota bacterium]
MRFLIRTLQIVLPLVVIGSAGFAAVMMIRSRPPVETQPPVFSPPGVQVHQVALTEVAMGVTSQGTVQPRTESQLVPEIAGRITWVSSSFAEGGFFEEGDVLVKIDPFDYEQALISARSQLAQARLRLAQEQAEAEVAEREWNDLGRGDPRALTLRKPQLDEAQASIDAAEAGVTRAERDLERAEVVAPYAGRVRQKNVDIGQFVRVGDMIATVYAVDVAEIRLPLPDDQIAYLDLPLSYRGGQQQIQPAVTLTTTFAGETHEWQGRIVRTESEIDPVSRMVHVVAAVLDPYAPRANPNQPPLAVGMYVEAEIEGRLIQNMATVPRAAVRGRNQVLVVSADEHLSFRNVDIFRSTTDAIYVRNGLSDGELVVISPLDTATDGMRVQIANADVDARVRAPEDNDNNLTGDAQTPASDTQAHLNELDDTTLLPEDVSANTETAVRPAWLDALVSNDALRTDNGIGAPTSEPATTEVTRAINSQLNENVDNTTVSDLPVTAPSDPEPVEEQLVTDTPISPEETLEITTVAENNRAARPGREAVAAIMPSNAIAAENNRATRSGREAVAAIVPSNAIAVVPFADLNLEDGSGLGTSVHRAIETQLQNTDGITTTAQQNDARYVINGAIQHVGPVTRVTARIVDTANDAVLGTIKIDGTASERSSLESTVATAILGQLGSVHNIADPEETAKLTTLAVLPFDHLNANTENGQSAPPNLGDTITNAVVTQVSTMTSIQFVSTNESAAWSVRGSIQQLGDLVRVTVRVSNKNSSAIVHAFKVDGSADDLATLTEHIMSALTETLNSIILNGNDTTARNMQPSFQFAGDRL